MNAAAARPPVALVLSSPVINGMEYSGKHEWYSTPTKSDSGAEARGQRRSLLLHVIVVVALIFGCAAVLVVVGSRRNASLHDLASCKTYSSRSSAVLASRYWGESSGDLQRLRDFVERSAASGLFRAVIIAVNSRSDRSGAAASGPELRKIAATAAPNGMAPLVIVTPLDPWGGVSHSLNILLHLARSECGAKTIVYQSPEVLATPLVLANMLREVDSDTLVAGIALPGHTPVAASTVVLDGLTSPWNTCAAWDVEKLGTTGFPTVSDEGSIRGMEEPAVIALLQSLRPALKAKLLIPKKASDVAKWATDFKAGRIDAHRMKMDSKMERTERHLHRLGVAGTVTVVTAL